MKKFFGALLLLPLVLVIMAQVVSAQDSMSVILPAPYNARVGSQLLYFFEEGAASRAPNVFKSYMTITNTSLNTYVAVHYQYYTNACVEVFNYVDVLTPGQTYVIDPANVMTTKLNRQGQQIRGSATDGRFLMTATAIDASVDPTDLRAISFNFLTGQIFITNVPTNSTWGTNAIARMAVDFWGAPLTWTSCQFDYVKGPYGAYRYAAGSFNACGAVLGNTIRGFRGGGSASGPVATDALAQQAVRMQSTFLQMFRPALLYVPNFFAPVNVDPISAGSAFGNRLTLVAFRDNYATGTNWYRLEGDTPAVTSFVFDLLEQPLSVPQRNISCVTEFTISPRTAGGVYATSTSGQVGGDFLGSSFAAHVSQGGWLRMTVTTNPAQYGNLFGWFSQALTAYGNGDLLVGVNRITTGVDLRVGAIGPPNTVCGTSTNPTSCTTYNLPATDSFLNATGDDRVLGYWSSASDATP